MQFNPSSLSPKPTAPASSSGTQGGRKSADIIRGIEGKYKGLEPGVDKVDSLRGLLDTAIREKHTDSGRLLGKHKTEDEVITAFRAALRGSSTPQFEWDANAALDSLSPNPAGLMAAGSVAAGGGFGGIALLVVPVVRLLPPPKAPPMHVGEMTINFPPGQAGANIAELPQENVCAVLNGVDIFFDRIATNGDGSCALHALLGNAMDSSGRLSLEDPMIERADISRLVQGLTSGDPAVTELLDQVVNTRVAFKSEEKRIFTEILKRYGVGMSGDYAPESKRNIIKDIFSQIIATQTGEGGQVEGQITPAELKLISVLHGVNVQLLSPIVEGSAKKMDVWRSQPDNPAGLITVVHTGLAHWERWQQHD